ncbi:spore coat protein [Bacillus sp. V59.32b]|uniref:spore coat protein n=1 Tax=Bacillus sp. V59.32b TaxID=1758642 RepID=UPI000E3CB490|nr:spore coat protein [Bacillus sp. V59.32b]RFU63168.1 coat F domain protein [Bacillus sp. V59.32b]
MPFGAHETMEIHEILMEKVNMITHFNFYATETQNQQLIDMIIRHQQEEIRSYNELVSYTHDYKGFKPVPPNTQIREIQPQEIRYGLNNPPQIAPEVDAMLKDSEIATAMLCCHKNAARNGMWATLECADPNLRRMLLNSAANYANQAYEVFLFMNEQGQYQVPTLKDHTAKTFIHRYQPANEALQAQYGMKPEQGVGYGQGAGGYQGQSSGFASQNTGFDQNAGFNNQNAGFGPNAGFANPNAGFGQNSGYAGQNAGFSQNSGFAGQNKSSAGNAASTASPQSILYGGNQGYAR